MSTAIRGPVLTYTGDPFKSGLESTMVYESDAIVAMDNGKITHFGPADKIQSQLPQGTEVKNYGKDSLISADEPHHMQLFMPFRASCPSCTAVCRSTRSSQTAMRMQPRA